MPTSPTDPADSDAEGLPPGAVLPDRKRFRRGQLWAMSVTSFVVLLLLLLWWRLNPESRVALICAGAAGVVFLINLARWLLAPRI